MPGNKVRCRPVSTVRRPLPKGTHEHQYCGRASADGTQAVDSALCGVGQGRLMAYKVLLMIALMTPFLFVAIGAMVHGPAQRHAPAKGELGLPP
jgi:hypothetical protein